MARTLPRNPNLEHLQKEAKHLLHAFKAGDPSVCEVLRYHYRFARASDENILKSEVTLQEVQHALALDYGFKSWKELKAHVEVQSMSSTSGGQPQDIINDMIGIAVKDRASDMHVEPMTADVKVRYRVDGVLYEMKPPSESCSVARQHQKKY